MQYFVVDVIRIRKENKKKKKTRKTFPCVCYYELLDSVALENVYIVINTIVLSQWILKICWRVLENLEHDARVWKKRVFL